MRSPVGGWPGGGPPRVAPPPASVAAVLSSHLSLLPPRYDDEHRGVLYYVTQTPVGGGSESVIEKRVGGKSRGKAGVTAYYEGVDGLSTARRLGGLGSKTETKGEERGWRSWVFLSDEKTHQESITNGVLGAQVRGRASERGYWKVKS